MNDNIQSKINKNAAYNIIKNVFAVIFPLISFPYISRVLGAANTGKINFASSVVSYFSLAASLGISTYAIRECARVQSDRTKLSTTASQIFSINMVSTLIAYALLSVTLIVAKPLNGYRELILIQSINMLFTTLGADWINTALSDFRYVALRTIFFQLLSLLLMFLLVRNRDDYVIYVIVVVIAASGANILNIIYRRRYCSIRLTKHLAFKTHIKQIMLLFSMILAQTIFVSTDTTILGLVRDDFEVGLYGVSTKIYSIVNTVISSIAWVVMPQLTELFEKKDYEKINGILKYVMNIIAALGLPAISGINLLAEEIILTLSGSEYAGAAMSLRILMISLACSFAGGFIGNIILLPSRRDDIMLKSSIISAAVNLLLNLVLIPMYGLNAAAATTAAANGVGFVYGLKYIDKNISFTGIRRIFKAPVIGTICMSIVVLIIKCMPVNLYVKTIAAIAAGGAAYGMVLLILKDKFAMNCLKQIDGKVKALVHRN